MARTIYRGRRNTGIGEEGITMARTISQKDLTTVGNDKIHQAGALALDKSCDPPQSAHFLPYTTHCPSKVSRCSGRKVTLRMKFPTINHGHTGIGEIEGRSRHGSVCHAGRNASTGREERCLTSASVRETLFHSGTIVSSAIHRGLVCVRKTW